jgi:hypothetical protein
MVPPPSMVPAPLPSLTLAQIQAWDTDHLDTAAGPLDVDGRTVGGRFYRSQFRH